MNLKTLNRSIIPKAVALMGFAMVSFCLLGMESSMECDYQEVLGPLDNLRTGRLLVTQDELEKAEKCLLEAEQAEDLLIRAMGCVELAKLYYLHKPEEAARVRELLIKFDTCAQGLHDDEDMRDNSTIEKWLNELSMICAFIRTPGLDKKLSNWLPPLHYAAQQGWVSFCEFLIGNKADVNKINLQGLSPLYYAADNGREDIWKMLIEAGALTTCTNSDGRTMLHMAVLLNNVKVVGWLIDHQFHLEIGEVSLDAAIALSVASHNRNEEILSKLKTAKQNMILI